MHLFKKKKRKDHRRLYYVYDLGHIEIKLVKEDKVPLEGVKEIYQEEIIYESNLRGGNFNNKSKFNSEIAKKLSKFNISWDRESAWSSFSKNEKYHKKINKWKFYPKNKYI